MMPSFPIIQVVGHKNAGKTTLMEKLIRSFSDIGYNVGSIKYHGHSGRLKTVSGTDSYRHSEAGAKISTVKGAEELHITVKDLKTLELEQLIELYASLKINFILIEGFKYADYPKIVLVKNEYDTKILSELTNIIAVGVRDDELLGQFDHYTFSLNRTDEEMNKLIEYIDSSNQG